MAVFERNGQWSHRHPLLGDGNIDDALAKAADKAKEQTSSVTTAAVLAPLLSGAIMTGVTYSVARAMEIEKSKSWGLAATMGIVTAFGQIASGWLRGWATKALEETTPAALPAPVTATVVSPTKAG